MSSKVVLIVDDDKKRFQAWRKKLRGKINVVCASSIEGAQKQFRKHASDLAAIAMDACVPGDSPNTLWLVREMRQTFNGPMIAISGSPLYREQLMDAGCNYQSPKDDLPAKIIEVLKL